MNQDPNPTDYPHLEAFVEWLYDNVERLPVNVETLKTRIQTLSPNELARLEKHSKKTIWEKAADMNRECQLRQDYLSLVNELKAHKNAAIDEGTIAYYQRLINKYEKKIQ